MTIKKDEKQIHASSGESIQMRDPRIESPDVKVIYPSPVDELTGIPYPKGKADKVIEEPTISPTGEPQEEPPVKKEEHVCKVDMQEAVKQNLLGFIVMIVLALGIGYLIGKR